MKKYYVLMMVYSILVLGCAKHPNSFIPANDLSLTLLPVRGKKPVDTPRREAQSVEDYSLGYLKGVNDQIISSLQEECGQNDEAEQSSTVLAGTDLAVGIALEYVITYAQDSLETMAKQYEAEFGQRLSDNLYYYNSDGKLDFAHRCFRLIRHSPPQESVPNTNKPSSSQVNEPKNSDVGFELIARIELSPDQTAMRIKPLMLYLRHSLARTDKTGRLLQSATADISAVWENPKSEIKSERLGSVQIYSGIVELPETDSKVGNFYFFDKPTSEVSNLPKGVTLLGKTYSDWFPVVPVSRKGKNDLPTGNDNTNLQGDAGNINLTVKVYETSVSSAPERLRRAAKVLGAAKGDIKKEASSVLKGN